MYILEILRYTMEMIFAYVMISQKIQWFTISKFSFVLKFIEFHPPKQNHCDSTFLHFLHTM